MGTFWQDMRYGVRSLRKTAGFTLVAVLTLALGIGANTAIFTVVNAVLLRPLAFKDPSRVVMVREKSPYPTFSTSYENYKDWRDESHSFESMQASCLAGMTLTGMGEPELLAARYTTAGFFPLLGVTPIAGRNFLPEEDRAEGAPVAIISYALWQRRFGGSADWMGKTIDLSSKPYTLIGVLPQGFQFLQPADVYVPFEPWAKTLPDDRNWHPGIFAVARLARGATIQQADAEMKGITARLEKQYPEFNTGISADVVTLQEQVVQNVRPALVVLLCVRERGEFAAGAGRIAREGNRYTDGAGSEPAACSSPASYGERCDRRPRRRTRTLDREPVARSFAAALGGRAAGCQRNPHRPLGAGVHGGGVVADGNFVRAAAGAANREARYSRHAE
jgi:hypothetical protein